MPHYLESRISFYPDKITIPSRSLIGPDEEVMMLWEEDIMRASADWVCSGGGDILEIGFGMGISANFIQNNNISSHTIVECHPDIIEKAYEWAEGRPNVIIVEGDWFNVRENLGKYDGIFYDTYADDHMGNFPSALPDLTKTGTRVTWWNNMSGPSNFYNLSGVIYDEIEVNPPQNGYFNYGKYYLPKMIF